MGRRDLNNIKRCVLKVLLHTLTSTLDVITDQSIQVHSHHDASTIEEVVKKIRSARSMASNMLANCANVSSGELISALDDITDILHDCNDSVTLL